MKKLSKLSKLEARAYKALANPANADVPIWKLYELVFDTNVRVVTNGVEIFGVSNRTMQQRLGGCIHRLNAKLSEGERVEPGEARQTYRLTTKAG